MGKKKEAIRVVLDTNVVVPALFFGGRLSVIRTAWREARITPVLSSDMFQELVNVLGCPKFSLSKEEISFVIEEEILFHFEIVEATEKATGVCSDAGDDKFLACAVSGGARYLVSGDGDLLELKEFKGIRIISPAELLKLL